MNCICSHKQIDHAQQGRGMCGVNHCPCFAYRPVLDVATDSFDKQMADTIAFYKMPCITEKIQ